MKAALDGMNKSATCMSADTELTPACSPPVPATWIYFIRSGDAVKIGFATNVDARFSSIQTSNPNKIELLAKFPGSTEDEYKTHMMFRHLHIRGEWFRDDAAIREYIQSRMPKPGRWQKKKLTPPTHAVAT